MPFTWSINYLLCTSTINYDLIIAHRGHITSIYFVRLFTCLWCAYDVPSAPKVKKNARNFRKLRTTLCFDAVFVNVALLQSCVHLFKSCVYFLKVACISSKIVCISQKWRVLSQKLCVLSQKLRVLFQN